MISIDKLVLFLIFLVVLLVILILIFQVGKPTASQLIIQNEIRQCCMAYRANGCLDDTIVCNDKTLRDLANEANILHQLKDFCECD
jgi:exopolysaccharide biosynthesis protein